MRRALAIALAVVLMAPAAALADSRNKGGNKGSDHKPGRVMAVRKDGHAYCFERAIVMGSTVVTGGRCYTFYLMRTHQGAFLAFGPPGQPMIPPGQIVRLSTPAGAKHRGRLFYLVPVSVPVTVVRMDEIRYVPVVVTPYERHVVIRVPVGGSAATSGGTQRDPEVNFVEQR